MSGIIRAVGEAAVAEVVAEASNAGVVVMRCDTTSVSTKIGVLTEFGQAFGAGDDFGLNLDALYDALRDLPVPLTLVWHGSAEFEADEPAAFAGVTGVFRAWADENDFTLVLA